MLVTRRRQKPAMATSEGLMTAPLWEGDFLVGAKSGCSN
jgi:hypothetical protein|tara:strand:+ start:117 stop:233 length:117 start_codon:yes stop_codon:yes gene_type:complete